MNRDLNNSFTKKDLFLVAALLVLVGITYFLIYQLNRFYPIFADDFPFSMVYGTTQRLESISQLITSQYLFFMDHSGRTIEHSIAQILLMLGTPWLDILQTFAFVCLCLTIYAIANFKKQTNPYLFCFIVLFIWFFQPAFAPTVLNITSGAVYMWGTLINLLFIYPYYKYYISDTPPKKQLKISLFFLFGIVAGWTQENMSPSMILIISAFTILRFRETKKAEAWTIAGIVGAVIGCALLVGAPGNYVRLDADVAALSSPTVPFYVNGIYNIIGGYFKHSIGISIVYIIGVGLYYFLPKKEEQPKVLLISILFIATSMIATALMIASPIFPARAWFGIVILMIVAIAILYANISFENTYLKVINWGAILVLCAVFAYQYRIAYVDLEEVYTAFVSREELIEEQKTRGLKDIILPEKIMPCTDFSNISDVMTDTTHWLYPVILGYYKVNSINRSVGTLDNKPVSDETK